MLLQPRRFWRRAQANPAVIIFSFLPTAFEEKKQKTPVAKMQGHAQTVT